MTRLKRFFIRDQDKNHNPLSEWREAWGVDEADAIRRDYLKRTPEAAMYKCFPRLAEELFEVTKDDD